MTVCEICFKGPMQGVTVYRQNAFGEAGIWRCRLHRIAKVDPEVQDIVDAIEPPQEPSDVLR